MREPAEEFTVGDNTVKIYYDDDPTNPRTDYDHLWHFWLTHRRYNLGDDGVDPPPVDDPYSTDDVLRWARRERGEAHAIYMYDHSGLTISLTPYSCPWDSGQVGWAYLTREEILKEYGGKVVTRRNRQLALELLQHEIDEYDSYLRGEVYGFVVEDADGNDINSCWGFVGDIEYVRGEARRAAEDQCHDP